MSDEEITMYQSIENCDMPHLNFMTRDELDKQDRESYEEWKSRTIFLPMSEIDNIWTTYPTLRIPQHSSWYAVINNEEELINLIRRVDGDHESFVANFLIKRVYIKEEYYLDECIDTDHEMFIDFVETTQQEEYYSVACNEYAKPSSQIEITKETEEYDQIRHTIVICDDLKDELTYPLMVNYYFNETEDRMSSYKINLTTFNPLVGMQFREGNKVFIKFRGEL